MVWDKLSKEESTNEFNRVNLLSAEDFKSEKESWVSRVKSDSKYYLFRNSLIAAFSRMDVYKGSSDYLARLDVCMGMEIFKLTQTDEYKISIRDASDDSIWSYLSFNVVPDLVYQRWDCEKDESIGHRLNADRLYLKSRRIWLKAIWWYVFLSLQFDDEGNIDYKRTEEILSLSSTDDMAQVVDRVGLGYIPELTRTIMATLYELKCDPKVDTDKLLRKVMKMNTARIKVCNPLLCGVDTYVKDLFREFI